MICCNSLYGSYRTRKFCQIFSEDDETYDTAIFINEFKTSGLYTAAHTDQSRTIKATLSNDSLNILALLLYGRFGNSHIKSSDETQFKIKLFSLIRQYGPLWEQKVAIQEQLRNLTFNEIVEGAKTIHNHAQADAGEEITTQSLLETNYINDQSTSNYKKSKIEAYLAQYDALANDATEQFLDKFNKLFIKYTSPDFRLVYESEYDEEFNYE